MKLYEITKANAEAMSIENAEKYLAEDVAWRKNDQYGEADDRDLAGYVLDVDEGVDWMNRANIKPPYKFHEQGDLGKNGANAFRALVRRGVPHSKLMTIEVKDAMALDPEVKKILEKKIAAPLQKLKAEASERTKRQFENASPERKGHILTAWLKKHDAPKSFAKSSKFDAIRSLHGDKEGGRRHRHRTARKGRTARKTRRHGRRY
jgi:hypothetical protein